MAPSSHSSLAASQNPSFGLESALAVGFASGLRKSYAGSRLTVAFLLPYFRQGEILLCLADGASCDSGKADCALHNTGGSEAKHSGVNFTFVSMPGIIPG